MVLGDAWTPHDLVGWSTDLRRELEAAAAAREAADRVMAPSLSYQDHAREFDRRVRQRMADDGVDYRTAAHAELGDDEWLRDRLAFTPLGRPHQGGV
jgi:hypothetical protein